MSENEAPAPARVKDGTAAAERAWVDEHAKEREDVFHVQRREHIAHVRQQRNSLTLLERHRLTAEEVARLSTVAAAQVGHSSRSADGPPAPPLQATVDFSDADRLIRRGIEMREEQLDELKGLGAARNFTTMMAHEKDAIILNELVGWSPAEIEVFYNGRLGSAETVRRLRRREKLSGRTGLPVEPRPAEAE